MATMKDSSEWHDLCQQFIAITNATPQTAYDTLEATAGNLQEAINLHMENSFNSANTSNYNSSDISDGAPTDQNKLVIILILLMNVLVLKFILYDITVSCR